MIHDGFGGKLYMRWGHLLLLLIFFLLLSGSACLPEVRSSSADFSGLNVNLLLGFQG